MKFEPLFFTTESLPPILTKEQTKQLFIECKNGNSEARNELINHNIALVINQVVKKFCTNNYDRRDLVSIGLIGLIKSVDTFDVNRNISFSTYATKCIDNEILMFLRRDKNKSYLIPVEDSYDKLSIENQNFFLDVCLEKELIAAALNSIKCLDDREREMLCLYLGIGRNECVQQREIAKMYNLSHEHVCRIMKKVWKK